jgi:aminopeptidase N
MALKPITGNKKTSCTLFIHDGYRPLTIVNDKWNNMEVNYYVEPAYAKYAKDIFGRTPEMLEFFSKKLKYKFPWDKYSQVVVRDFVSGAMENTTAVTFMEATV